MRFEVVEVDPVTVDLAAQTVAGPMDKFVGVTRRADNLPNRIVNFPTLRITPASSRFLQKLDASISCASDDVEVDTVWRS